MYYLYSPFEMSVHITNNFLCPAHSSPLSLPPLTGLVAMESSSVASASSEAGSTRSQDIEELERFIDSYVLEYQVQGLLSDKNETDQDVDKTPSHTSQVKHTPSFTKRTLSYTSQVKHTASFTSQIIYTLSIPRPTPNAPCPTPHR